VTPVTTQPASNSGTTKVFAASSAIAAPVSANETGWSGLQLQSRKAGITRWSIEPTISSEIFLFQILLVSFSSSFLRPLVE
jgi:hypothetical protein